MDAIEAESLTLTLISRALGERTSHPPDCSCGRQKVVDRAKLVLASDPGRRWTLADIAAVVGVSPVYLTHSCSSRSKDCPSIDTSCSSGWLERSTGLASAST